MKIARLACALFAVTLYLPILTSAGFAQSSCSGLCLQQVSCPNNGTTSITGTVYAPNATVPLPNVIVYVPNGGSAPDYGVQPLAPGVSNPPTVSGSPLVSTFSSANGTFTLQNMPVGTNIPLVIQAGKWRRMISIPSVASCTNTAVAAASTSLPQYPEQYSSLDNIPRIAVVTGQFDDLECTVRQIGVNSSQFTDPSGTGAVNFYLGDAGPGAQIDSNTPTEDSLWSTQSQVDTYDLLLLPSQSASNDPAASAANQAKLVSYANAGGRVFTSGDSWDWLYNVLPFSGTVAWEVNQGTSSYTDTGFVDEVSNPYGQTFASWLVSESISGTPGQIPGITGVSKDYNGVIAPTSQWLYVNDATLGSDLSQIFSFDTPVGAPAGNHLGRVFFKDATYGEVPVALTTGVTFPAECSNTTPPSQLVLDFLLFNLSGNLPLPQTISFTTPAPSSAANNTNFTVAATATSDLTVSFSGSGGCSYVDHQDGTATYTMNSGTTACSVIASQPGSGAIGANGPVDYAAAPQVTETTLVPQTITFTMNPPPSAYLTPGPGNQFTVAAIGGGSNNPVTFTSSGSCTNVGGNYTMSQIPTTACLVIANQAGDGVNYAAAPTVTQTVQIGQVWYDLSSPPNPPSNAPYGSSFYTVTGTTTSELPPTYAASGVCNVGPTTEQIVGGIPEWSATYTMTSGTGTCAIHLSIAGNATWATEPTINLLPVTTATKATNTVTLNNVPSSAEYGSSFTISASGLGTGAISYSSDGVVCTNSGATYTMISGTGSCTATATQAADSNYDLASKSGSVAAIPPANCSGIFAPANNATLGGTSATFSWCATGGATAYWIDVGSAPGGNTYYQSGSLPSTTFAQTVNSLPSNGSTVYVTWWYLVGGVWQYTEYSYTAVGGTGIAIATLTNPAPSGSTLSASSQTFTWQSGTDNIANYWIDVGSSAGGNNYYQSGSLPISTTSVTVNNLPLDGSEIFVTLYSLVGGTWFNNAYNFYAVSANSCVSTITSPAPGSELTAYSDKFAWTPSSNPNCAGAVTAYWLDAGTDASENFYDQSGNIGNVLTWNEQNLPPGYSEPPATGPVQMTLWNLIGGNWVASPEVGYCAYGSSGYPGCTGPTGKGAAVAGKKPNGKVSR
jgi:hypothetical protein